MAKPVLLLLKEDAGATGIALAIVVAVNALGSRVNTDFTNVLSAFK